MTTETIEKVDKASEGCKMIDGIYEKLANSLLCPETEAQFQEVLKFNSRFHSYSMGNVLWLYAQNQNITRVAGFHKWKSMGRMVKKGEKGLMVLAPSTGRIYLKDESEAKGRSVSYTKDGTPYINIVKGFRVEYVFDISQTDGDEIPELEWAAAGDPGEAKKFVEVAYAKLGVKLEYGDTGSTETHGFARHTTPVSVIVRDDLEPAQTVRVLLHELTHALLHCNDKQSKYLSRDHRKSVVELEADSVAYIVGTHIGLDMTGSTFYSRSYHSGKTKEETVEALKESMGKIQKTAKLIIENMGG